MTTDLAKYLKSLKEKNFHKLIIGAALKDFKSIEEYAYLFTHAQADAIDISAFPHSVISATQGIQKAIKEDKKLVAPLIMISVNIGQDPHFRRIELNTTACTECLECIPTCPSEAFTLDAQNKFSYDIDLCFGCSNCLPACEDKALSYQSWNAFDSASLKELQSLGARAIEIHLNHDLDAFIDFYNKMQTHFELESFCIGSHTASKIELERTIDSIIKVVFEKQGTDFSFIIQVDGIPMSGARDFKNLSTQDKDQHSINKAKIALDYIKNKYPTFKKQIYIQLAGGTNDQSLKKALDQKVPVNGVAIGSFARKKIKEVTETQKAIEIAKKILQVV